MAVFDELVTSERMEDPEERKAEDLARSNETIKKRSLRVSQTSVSYKRYKMVNLVIRLVLSSIAVVLLSSAVYYGVILFVS